MPPRTNAERLKTARLQRKAKNGKAKVKYEGIRVKHLSEVKILERKTKFWQKKKMSYEQNGDKTVLKDLNENKDQPFNTRQ